jgi:beta-glucanase (GH16 family)
MKMIDVLKKMLVVVVSICMLAVLVGCKKDDSGITQPKPTVNDSIPELLGWKLVWNDEFNEGTLDSSKWEYEVYGGGSGNNELQYYTDRQSNSYIENGALIIGALKEEYQGSHYTSARVRTKYKGDWKYGHFEIRAKLPYGKGLWPAIWMMPTDGVYGGWPRSGEIDIMECLGDNTWKVYGTVHFADSYGNHLSVGSNYSLPMDSASFAGNFHVFTIEWDSTSIHWFVDGNEYYLVSTSAPFDQRFHLILNVAVGGNWPGNPNEFTTFPQIMAVDYVRVYQRP